MSSLPQVLRTTAGRNPDREAIIFGARTRTYREFADEVERMSSVFASLGMRKGDRVLLLAGNTDSFVIAAYSVLRVGAILVPVNPGSAAPELAYLLSNAEASFLIIVPAFSKLAREGTVSSNATVLCLGATDDYVNVDELVATSNLPHWWSGHRRRMTRCCSIPLAPQDARRAPSLTTIVLFGLGSTWQAYTA